MQKQLNRYTVVVNADVRWVPNAKSKGNDIYDSISVKFKFKMNPTIVVKISLRQVHWNSVLRKIEWPLSLST